MTRKKECLNQISLEEFKLFFEEITATKKFKFSAWFLRNYKSLMKLKNNYKKGKGNQNGQIKKK